MKPTSSNQACTNKATSAIHETKRSTFCDTHPQLQTCHCLRFFYTPKRRMEPRAKTEFIEPDLAPLPRIFSPDDIAVEAVRPDAPDAASLISELEAHLASIYPPESRHGFSIERLIAESVAFFVLRVKNQPAGCGGIKFIDGEYGEIKRMYVRPQFRLLGLGRVILDHLADYACKQSITVLRLETGMEQQAAIRLYERAGFRRISRFEPYVDSPLSLCFEKRMRAD